jgi:transglutaminase-like putative cysteine protease
MRKFLASLTLSMLLLFVCFGFVYAEGEFATSSVTTYDVDTTGKTTVTHTITLENLFTDLYATNYGLTLNQDDITQILASDKTGKLPTEISVEDGSTTIKLGFNDILVGKGEKRQFSVSYLDPSIASYSGQVWEIVIPGKTRDDTHKDNGTILKVPNSFGRLSYISPDPANISSEGNKRVYSFSSSEGPITAAFGEFQVFSFDLTYHLENPLATPAYTEIALPPDTSYQKIHIKELEPKPNQVEVDSDGNWIARYDMKPRDRFDVKAKGFAQMFSQPVLTNYPDKQTLEDSLKPTEYWQSDDPEIIKLAQSLKTPKAIYDYVSQNLKYDYERVRPNVDRLGAKKALESPTMAICMEFTDLFVALARAANIPAREVNGYAYTENPEIQPLSLVADVLHAWPEYWDATKNRWVQVDPTWGSTSGVDFYNKLDLRHLAFVIHGKDANLPYPPGSYKLGSNPQKDVFVNFSQFPSELPESKLDIKVDNFKVKATNSGPTSLQNPKIEVYFDDELSQTYESKTLPSFGSLAFDIPIPQGFLGRNLPQNIKLVSGDQSVVIPTNRQNVIIHQLIVILSFILLTVSFVLIFVKRKKIILFIKNHAKIPNFKSRFKKHS